MKLSKLEKAEKKVKIVDSSNWAIKSPKNSTLDTSKINSLDIHTTPLYFSLSEIKKEIIN